tara:strand:+ start:814 stop:1926 length:1113 start_codon:yes stop_codon:yes gene_type:complete
MIFFKYQTISKTRLLIFTCIFTHVILFSQNSIKVNKKVENIVKQYGENEFSGSILLKSNDSIIHNSSYGYAQKEEKLKYTNNTSFSIGSIGKMITATIIMQLNEQGKINLHDPISNYLRNIPKNKQQITIHHLLTHTSGLPDFFISGDDFKRVKKVKAFRKIRHLKLQSTPGRKYSYSNSGYNLLAMIIEQVIDDNYLDYATNLFKSLGMSNTGFSGKMLWKENKIARGYGFDSRGDNTPNSWPIPSWTVIGTGEVISNTSDMIIWMDKLFSYKIINKQSLKLMFTNHVKTGKPKNTFYGYGWKIRELKNGKRRIYHNGGGDFGQIATIRFYPDNDDKNILIVLSNSYNVNPPKALTIAHEIEKNILTKK